jgi:hypothetical protein
MLTTQRRDRRVCRRARFLLESLDDRLVLSAGAGGAAAEAVVHHQAADHAHLDHHSRRREVLGHGSHAVLPLNVSPGLRLLYREYENQGGGNRFTPGLPRGRPLEVVGGRRVAVLIKAAFPPALGAYLRDFRADGLRVIHTLPAYGLAEGTLPIAALPAAAQDAAQVWPAPPSIARQSHRVTH